MANTLLTPQMVTKAAVALWKNSNAFLQHVDTQYSDQFARTGAKIGATINVRKPASFTVTNGAALAVQNTVETQTPLTVGTQKHVDIAFTSAEQSLSLMEFTDLILKPAIANLTASVAADVMGLANTVPNWIGNGMTIGSGAGTLASPTATTFNLARAQLGLNSTPAGDLNAILDYQTDARTASSLAGLFNPTGRISEIFDSGEVKGPAIGIANWWSDQTVQVFQGGTFTAMPTVNGANQTGSTITVTAGTAANLVVGDVITFAGVYAVNPLTFLSTGQLRQFVVTAAYANGTSLDIYPALTPVHLTGGLNDTQYANVTTSPATGAAISLAYPTNTQYRKNLVMHKSAFTLATVDLPVYGNGVIAAHRESMDGVSLRFLQAYDPTLDREITRIDVLYGYAPLMPERACVVADVL